MNVRKLPKQIPHGSHLYNVSHKPNEAIWIKYTWQPSNRVTPNIIPVSDNEFNFVILITRKVFYGYQGDNFNDAILDDSETLYADMVLDEKLCKLLSHDPKGFWKEYIEKEEE